MERADRRRRRRELLWLVEGQVRLLVADHPEAVERADGRPGPGQVAASHAGDASDEEDHRGRFGEGAYRVAGRVLDGG